MSAIISSDQKYRYRLTRTLNAMGDSVCFIMLNPSTADAEKDDPTIRRCKDYVLRLGYGQLEVVNLFAYRATDPDVLYGMSKLAVIGPENDKHIAEAACAAHLTICAWGNHGILHGRDREVIKLLCFNGIQPHALKINAKSGQPGHPLYLKSNAQPIPLSPHEPG